MQTAATVSIWALLDPLKPPALVPYRPSGGAIDIQRKPELSPTVGFYQVFRYLHIPRHAQDSERKCYRKPCRIHISRIHTYLQNLFRTHNISWFSHEASTPHSVNSLFSKLFKKFAGVSCGCLRLLRACVGCMLEVCLEGFRAINDF